MQRSVLLAMAMLLSLVELLVLVVLLVLVELLVPSRELAHEPGIGNLLLLHLLHHLQLTIDELTLLLRLLLRLLLCSLLLRLLLCSLLPFLLRLLPGLVLCNCPPLSVCQSQRRCEHPAAENVLELFD